MRTDSYEKVTGKAKYTGDLKLPGMVYARILRSPSHGAKMASVDVSGAEKIESVTVVRDGDLIAVLSENRDKADEAIVKIKAEYSFDELKVNDKTVLTGSSEFKYLFQLLLMERRDKSALDTKMSDKVFETELKRSLLASAI
jgi:CO/xanthine dehydrogenase Mo-binding subunit